jgi:hypothetical protein
MSSPMPSATCCQKWVGFVPSIRLLSDARTSKKFNLRLAAALNEAGLASHNGTAKAGLNILSCRWWCELDDAAGARIAEHALVNQDLCLRSAGHSLGRRGGAPL